MHLKINLIKYIKQYWKHLILIIFIGGCLLYIYIKDDKNKLENENSHNLIINDQKTENKEVISKIKVDVKGAVVKPDVYELEDGSRVIDAINKSGGLTNIADTSLINLSKILADEMVIIIYAKEEVKKSNEEHVTIKYVEKECDCPKVTNDACIQKEEDDTTIEDNKISLNKASASELESLPGIGNSKANEIIKYRDDHGEFKSIDELKEISGIGTETFEKIKDLVTI